MLDEQADHVFCGGRAIDWGCDSALAQSVDDHENFIKAVLVLGQFASPSGYVVEKFRFGRYVSRPAIC